MTEYIMEGVELISTEAIQHYDPTPGGWWVWVVAITLGILTFLGIFLLLSNGGDGCSDIVVALIISVAVAAFFGTFVHDQIYPPVPTYVETRYEVYVHDEVDYTEFVDRFEVIDQNGDVYVVREKNSETESED